MKTPIDTVKGRIVDYDERTQVMTIKCKYPDWQTMTRRNYKECTVQMLDSRPLSDKQRRACYALIRAIADFTGDASETDYLKETLKYKFIVEELQGTIDHMFSLSNAPMSLVASFQKFLIDLILAWDIPCKFPLIDFVDDVEAYVYSCATHKKCCVCGQAADGHHVDRIGSGRDRELIDQTGMLMEPLCRKHHMECHTMPQREFDAKYHIKPVAIDDALKKIWKIHGTRQRADKKTSNRRNVI